LFPKGVAQKLFKHKSSKYLYNSSSLTACLFGYQTLYFWKKSITHKVFNLNLNQVIQHLNLCVSSLFWPTNMKVLKSPKGQSFSKNNIFKCLKMCFLLTCFVFFAIQVQLFFTSYLENATVLGITYQKMQSKAYPSITFCPEYVLKGSGVAINRQDFDQLSYKVVVSFNKYLEFNSTDVAFIFRKTFFTVLLSRILRVGYGILP